MAALALAALGFIAPAFATFATTAPSANTAQVSAAPAEEQLAYFQRMTIFHDGLRKTHNIALTFDDGPNENTRALLDVLDRYHIKATFFIVGNMAKAHPKVLAEIAARGHLLGNHSATHPILGDKYVRDPQLLIDQIRDTDDLIRPYMKPDDPLFFRAPYGIWRTAHAQVLNADPVLKYYVGPIYWDIGGDTKLDSDGTIQSASDWDCWHRGWSPETCAKGYLREIARKQGGVVLMHAVSSKAAELVEEVVPKLIANGYTFLRLDEIREYDQYKTPPENDENLHLRVFSQNTPKAVSGKLAENR
jgi:peptidoglycan/xylan/chitin deacetylase (PgdA/CDA1 family)